MGAQATFGPGQGRSSFAGFAPWVPGRLIGNVDVRLGVDPPEPVVMEDVLCLPKRKALYDRAGARIALSTPTWLDPDIPSRAWQKAEFRALDDSTPPAIVPPDKLHVVEEPVLYLGAFVRHYGLFLMDALARAWALARVDPATKVAFAPPVGEETSPPYARAILAALDIPPERMVPASRNLLLRRAILPLPLMQLGRRVYRGFDGPHRAAGARLGQGGTDAFAGRRVYLSRSGLGQAHRAIDGEAALEARLEREGFAIVHPQTLPLADQIAIFETASTIVGQQGSALHTLAFRRSERALRTACLTWSDLNGRFLLLDALKPVDAWYLRCMTPQVGLAQLAARALGRPVVLNEERFRLDVPRALDLLSDAGFLDA